MKKYRYIIIYKSNLYFYLINNNTCFKFEKIIKY